MGNRNNICEPANGSSETLRQTAGWQNLWIIPHKNSGFALWKAEAHTLEAGQLLYQRMPPAEAEAKDPVCSGHFPIWKRMLL